MVEHGFFKSWSYLVTFLAIWFGDCSVYVHNWILHGYHAEYSATFLCGKVDADVKQFSYYCCLNWIQNHKSWVEVDARDLVHQNLGQVSPILMYQTAASNLLEDTPMSLLALPLWLLSDCKLHIWNLLLSVQDWSPHMSFILKGSQISAFQLKGWFNLRI